MNSLRASVYVSCVVPFISITCSELLRVQQKFMTLRSLRNAESVLESAVGKYRRQFWLIIIWPAIRHVPFKTVILKYFLDFFFFLIECFWVCFVLVFSCEHYSLYVETNINFQFWANWQIQIQILLIGHSSLFSN